MDRDGLPDLDRWRCGAVLWRVVCRKDRVGEIAPRNDTNSGCVENGTRSLHPRIRTGADAFPQRSARRRLRTWRRWPGVHHLRQALPGSEGKAIYAQPGLEQDSAADSVRAGGRHHALAFWDGFTDGSAYPAVVPARFCAGHAERPGDADARFER